MRVHSVARRSVFAGAPEDADFGAPHEQQDGMSKAFSVGGRAAFATESAGGPERKRFLRWYAKFSGCSGWVCDNKGPVKMVTILLAATAIWLGMDSPVLAKAGSGKVTLSDLAGNYTGFVTMTAQDTSSTTFGSVVSVTGRTTLSIKALKNDRGGSISVNGSMIVSGSNVPVKAKFTLRNGRFRVDNSGLLVMSAYNGTFTIPGSGTYTRTSRGIDLLGTAAILNISSPFSGSIQTTTRGHTQKLVFLFGATSAADSTVYSFTFNISRHVK
jgi:hypothetical protein